MYVRRSLVFLCVLCALCGSNLFAAEPQFTISYWCGPPAPFNTVERYQEIKDAGFTLAFPPCSSMTVADNRKMLDNCQKVGLKAVVQDPRMPVSIGNNDANKKAVDGIIKDYGDHPALAGYHIVDEPGAGAYPGLAEVVAYIKEKDPKHPGFINLLPTYGRDFNVLGTKTYTEYVDQYAKIVKPFVISYDHYHFTWHGDRPDFFENLETVRKVSVEHNIPFWNIVLAIQHFDYRNLNEAEMRYEAMQTLAFGAHGLLWFTYWSPADPNEKRPREKREVIWEHSIIDEHGKRDPHYDMVKRINADALAIGSELVKCRSTEVFQPGKVVTTQPSIAKYSPPVKPSDACPIQAMDDDDLTIGVFKSPDGKNLALVTSRDYKKELTTRVTVKPANNPVEAFDPATKQWSPAPIRERAVIELTLKPGGGILLRW